MPAPVPGPVPSYAVAPLRSGGGKCRRGCSRGGSSGCSCSSGQRSVCRCIGGYVHRRE